MAVYRCEVKAISRGAGRSCVAAAAYRAAGCLEDERQGMTHDYSRKAHVEHSEIVSPADAPDWVTDRGRLWNAADASEKRKDAITAREVLLTLPRELSTEQNAALVRGFCQQFTERGIVADIAIHAPDGLPDPETGEVQRQPHAHVMLTDRPLTREGWAKAKDRTLSRPEGIEALRESWADHANRALERAGMDQRVDHRSLERQRAAAAAIGDEIEAARLDRPPEPKIGSVAAAMVREGRGDEAHAWNDAQMARRERTWRDSLAETWRAVKTEVADLVRQVGAERDRLADAARALMPDLALAGQQMQLREAGLLMAERQRQEQARAEEARKAAEKQRKGRVLRPGGRGGHSL